MKKTLKFLIFFPFMLWLVMLIIVPLLLIVWYAFNDKTMGFTLNNFALFFNSDFIRILMRSLYLSFIATVCCLFIGYPVALILSGNTFKKSSLILIILLAPMWMNFLLRTYAWLTLLEGSGVINTILKAIGFAPKVFLGNDTAVVFGMIYNLLPYMIFPIYNAIIKIPHNLLEASTDLGANALQSFSKIILPLSVSGIVSGVTMVFVPGVTTFVISQFLGGGNIVLIGDIIEQQFTRSGNWGFGAAISIIVMFVVVICMWFVNRFSEGPEVNML